MAYRVNAFFFHLCFKTWNTCLRTITSYAPLKRNVLIQIMNREHCLCFFQTCERLVKGLFAEHKKTRVPGEPRDFVDCYLDELDKVRVENIVLRVFLCGANNS